MSKVTLLILLLTIACAAAGGEGYKKCDSVQEEAAYQTCLSRVESKERADREYYHKQFEPKRRTVCETVNGRTTCEEE
jgi:hypothetical protein